MQDNIENIYPLIRKLFGSDLEHVFLFPSISTIECSQPLFVLDCLVRLFVFSIAFLKKMVFAQFDRILSPAVNKTFYYLYFLLMP